MRIFFFQKRNPNTGELLEEYLDADERNAWSYYNVPRFYKYIGWSDGHFMQDVAKKIRAENLTPGKDARGITVQPAESTKELLREAQRQEIEFAKTNPDKTPPRELTRSYLRESDAKKLDGTKW